MKFKLKLISSIISILSIIPAIYVFIYVSDVFKLSNHEAISPERVDEILSRTVSSTRFLIPMITLSLIVICQGIVSAFLLKFDKSLFIKIFVFTNIIFGGLAVSNIFLALSNLRFKNIKTFKLKWTKKIFLLFASAIPLTAAAMWIRVDSPDNPTDVSEVVLNERQGSENVIEIFTDGFDPINTKPLFDRDSTFGDFIAMDRVITGGYLTEPSYPQMMGGFERNPFTLRKEFESNTYAIPSSPKRDEYSAYLHDNFLDAVLNRLGADGQERGYIANPDDLGYFKSYFQHVSGSSKVITNRNLLLNKINKEIESGLDTKSKKSTVVDKIGVINWGQAKNETANGIINNIQNNAAIYKWVSSNIKTVNDDSQTGSRIFLQDSLTHSPRTVDENGNLSFSQLEQMGWSLSNRAFKGAHTVIHNFIQELRSKYKTAFDNSLIVIYGDHSDHANPTPTPGEFGDAKGYEKGHSQILIKYPHTKQSAESGHLIDDYTPFSGTNLKHVISDYFKNKNQYDSKSASEQMQAMQALIKTHSNNEFMVWDADTKVMNASFVKWFIDENNHSNDVIVPSKYDFLQEDKTISPADNWLTYGEWADQNNPNHDKIMELYNRMGWK